MPSVTFSFGAKTKTFTVSAGGVARFHAWALATYPTIPNPTFNPALPINQVTNPLTIPNPDPIISAIDGMWEGFRTNVKNWEKSVAVGAVASPPDVT